MKCGHNNETSKYKRLDPYKCAIPEENGGPLYLHQESNRRAARFSAQHPINTISDYIGLRIHMILHHSYLYTLMVSYSQT
jgi:hypothetical protein